MAIKTFTVDDPRSAVCSNPTTATVRATAVTATFTVPLGFNYISLLFPTLTASTKMWVRMTQGGNTIANLKDTRGSSYPCASFGSGTIRTFFAAPGSNIVLAASRVTATYTLSAFCHKG